MFTIFGCKQSIRLCSESKVLDGYEWADVSIFTDDFVKNYDVNGDKGYLLEVDVEYLIEMRIAHEDLPFLSERKVKSTKSHSNYEFDEITIEKFM